MRFAKTSERMRATVARCCRRWYWSGVVKSLATGVEARGSCLRRRHALMSVNQISRSLHAFSSTACERAQRGVASESRRVSRVARERALEASLNGDSQEACSSSSASP